MEVIKISKTALVTGASGGLGAEFARIHASKGGNLILVARSADKLKALQDKFTAQYSVAVMTIAVDLSLPESAGNVYRQVQDAGIQVDYLINNAGFGLLGDFASSDSGRQQEMVQLNIVALMQLTRLFLPGMMERHSGRILNVASTAAFQPGPFMAVYFATKAFVLSFSEALAVEMKHSGVTVSALCPGATDTGFKDVAAMQQSMLFKKSGTAEARDVAIYGYKVMLRGQAVGIYGLKNSLMAFGVRFAPRKLVAMLSAYLLTH